MFMEYYEAVANAILRIGTEVKKPVRLLCDVGEQWVEVYVKIGGKWVSVTKVYGFNRVTHREVEEFILGVIEDAE